MGGGGVKATSGFLPAFFTRFMLLAFSIGSGTSVLASTIFSFTLPFNGLTTLECADFLVDLSGILALTGAATVVFFILEGFALEDDVLEALEEAPAFFLLF